MFDVTAHDAPALREIKGGERGCNVNMKKEIFRRRYTTFGRIVPYCLLGAVWIVVCIFFPEFMPRCLFRLALGYDCPACGAQRALMHMAAGEFGAGFWSNPYMWLMMPYALLVLAAEAGGEASAVLRRRITGRPAIVAVAAVMTAWWILRNTSLWHSLLAANGVCDAL